MRKFMFVLLMFLPSLTFAAQWVTVNVSNIDAIQWVQSTNAAGQNEGLYISLKTEITGEAANYCTRKNFIVITDSKLADRVYSGVLFAISTDKQIQLFLDGSGKCAYNGPIATIFTLRP